MASPGSGEPRTTFDVNSTTIVRPDPSWEVELVEVLQLGSPIGTRFACMRPWDNPRSLDQEDSNSAFTPSLWAMSDSQPMSDQDQLSRGRWTRYVRAGAAVHPELFPDRRTDLLSQAEEYRAHEIDLTLGVEHDGSISISGFNPGVAASAPRPLLKLELTSREAERLRDLLIWALADLPATMPPPPIPGVSGE